jgi:hypothetical protein
MVSQLISLQLVFPIGFKALLPVVPRKAVAEVSKIGNLYGCESKIGYGSLRGDP